jgi:hypothetical protein
MIIFNEKSQISCILKKSEHTIFAMRERICNITSYLYIHNPSVFYFSLNVIVLPVSDLIWNMKYT